jgi:hypothetical protein
VEEILGPKRVKVTLQWRKHKKELNDLHSSNQEE